MSGREVFWVVGVAGLLSLGLLGCTEPEEKEKGPAGGVAGAAGPFHDRLLEIARSYEEYHRVDPSIRWGLVPCADKSPSPPAHLSASGDQGTHGRKLYWLFVKEMPPGSERTGAYALDGEPNPVGQAVVKEAWRPEPADERAPQEKVSRRSRTRRGEDVEEREEPVLPYARDGDGRLYHAAEKAALFVMFKLDPRTPGTDAGWVYGTLTADGRQVTSAGKVESCMGCHQTAPHDRLFGLPLK
jgi:hypothetical protein